jgi:hypothetical protein
MTVTVVAVICGVCSGIPKLATRAEKIGGISVISLVQELLDLLIHQHISSVVVLHRCRDYGVDQVTVVKVQAQAV